MKKKILCLIIFLGVYSCLIIPNAYAARNHLGENGGKIGGGGHNVSGISVYCLTKGSGCPDGANTYWGLRLSVVDVNGKRVSGTISADFYNSRMYDSLRGKFKTAKIKYTRQEMVLEGKDSAWSKGTSNTYKISSLYDICGNDCSKKITGLWGYQSSDKGSAHNFFEQLKGQKYDASVQNFMKKYLKFDVKSQGCNKNYYLTYEPIMETHISGTQDGYLGTVTELSNYSTSYNLKPRFRDMYIPAITIPTKKVGLKGSQLEAGNSKLIDRLEDDYGVAIGVLWVDDAVTCCDYNNPEHFHVMDGSDDQDYKPNDMTSSCCDWAISTYGDDAKKKYPICGACPVQTTSKQGECGVGNSVELTDVSNAGTINAKFQCLYQGVSGKGANKYSYSSRQSVRKKYKVGTIGSKYCEVYCIDDIIGQFPGNYEGQVTPGGSLIWPSYNNDYKATLQTTRTCKIRFRQQEWLNAFNKGNSTKKNSLVKALKECAGQNSILAYYDKYIKSLNPTLALSYNNGVTTIGPKNLKLDTKRSTYSKTCNGCNVNTSGLSVSNVVSKLNSIANGITNKVLTIKTNLRYVLPDGLYQYADKKTGLPLENYTPGKEINSNGTKNNTKIIDTGSSKLVIDEKAKTGQKYNLTIDYNKLSVVSGKFKNENGKYTCKYTPTTGNCPPGTPDCPSKTCDYNEPSHFKDIDGDGKLDSGPNGEDCCEWFANKYGTSSEEYKKLVSRGDCPDPGPDPDPDPDPDCTPGDPDCPYGNSCVYPRDLATPDIAVKNKCCAMILVDKRYSLEERKQYYQQYCTGKPYCPQDCENGKCTDSPMTQRLRNCMATGKSYNECKIDNCPGSGRILIYRPISLIANEAFPGVNKENRIWSNNNWYYYSNWAYRGNSKKRDYYVKEYITNNRGVKEYNIYNLAPMYTIKLDAKAIRSIRNYNKTNSYDDFNLKCTDGRKCKSTYIRQKITGIVSGCGVSSDWYACQGISAERGD